MTVDWFVKMERLTTTMRVHRARLDLTQAELATRAGITRKSINAIEAGQMVPSTVLALKLARALDLKVEELFSLEACED
jgi:putative transcriptional regulator